MSVLKKLEDASILSFKLSKDKKSCETMEHCDYYFICLLDKNEMQSLIQELAAIYSQMVAK